MNDDLTLDLDLQQYWRLARQWVWLIALCAVVAGGAAFAVSRWVLEPIYAAQTTLLIQPSNAYGNTSYQDILAGERVAETYADIVQSRPIRDRALVALGYTDPQAFVENGVPFDLDVESVASTQLIDITVESPDRQFAMRFADALAQAFIDDNRERQSARYETAQQELIDQISSTSEEITALQAELAATEDETARGNLELRIAQLEDAVTRYSAAYQNVALSKLESTDLISVVEPARLPPAPVRPRTSVNTLLAAVVGAMVAVGGVFLREMLDTSVKSPDEVAALTDAAVLGQIWHEKAILSANGQGSKIVLEKPLSLTAEAFRLLRANLQFASVDEPVQTLLVTSTGPTEGKSTISLNLGLAIALTGKRVILIDADMRKPRLHTYAQIAREPGLSDALADPDADLVTYLTSLTGTEGVQILPAGSVPPNPAELLGSRRMGELLALCGSMADLVIVDSPPLLAAADAAVLAPQTDGVLLVAEPGSTDRKAIVQATEQVKRTNARLLGSVLNKVPTTQNGGYYYYHYYQDAPEQANGLLARLLPGQRKQRRRRREPEATAK